MCITNQELTERLRKFNSPKLDIGTIPKFGEETREVLRYLTQLKNFLKGNNIEIN